MLAYNHRFRSGAGFSLLLALFFILTACNDQPAVTPPAITGPLSGNVSPVVPAGPAPTLAPAPLGPPGGTPAAPVASANLCHAANLRGQAGWQVTGGALAGSFNVTNTGGAPCTLQGQPTITLLGDNNAILPTTELSATQGGNAVQLATGERAGVLLGWRNWCGAPPRTITLQVVLPGNGETMQTTVNGPTSPACSDNQQNSAIFVGNFNPVLQ